MNNEDYNKYQAIAAKYDPRGDQAKLLADIQARVDKAPKGPWRHIRVDGKKNQSICVFEEIIAEHNPDKPLATVTITAWKQDKTWAVPLAQFIANARTDIPDLLAIIDKQRKALEFYAEGKNIKHDTRNCIMFVAESGDIAREALSFIPQDKEKG